MTRKLINIILVLFLCNIWNALHCQEQPSNSIVEHIANTCDSNYIKNLITNENELALLFDSIIYYAQFKNVLKKEIIYKAVTCIGHYSDGASTELVSSVVFALFKIDPISMLKYNNRCKNAELEDFLLVELCLNIGENDEMQKKEDVVSLLVNCKKRWRRGATYIDTLIKRFEKFECK